MNIKVELMKLGIHEDNLDNHYSDLYVRRSPKVLDFLNDHKIKYKAFICQRTNEIWLEIPFGNMFDYLNEKNRNGVR